MAVFLQKTFILLKNPNFNYLKHKNISIEKLWITQFGPMGPSWSILGPILGPNRGMFLKLNGPGPLESEGYPHTSFNSGKFPDTYKSFHISVT